LKSGHVNLMSFNKVKCKVLHLDQGILGYQYKLEELIESSAADDLWVLVDRKPDVSQQCTLITWKELC